MLYLVQQTSNQTLISAYISIFFVLQMEENQQSKGQYSPLSTLSTTIKRGSFDRQSLRMICTKSENMTSVKNLYSTFSVFHTVAFWDIGLVIPLLLIIVVFLSQLCFLPCDKFCQHSIFHWYSNICLI